jgi:hypothetical protein
MPRHKQRFRKERDRLWKAQQKRFKKREAGIQKKVKKLGT